MGRQKPTFKAYNQGQLMVLPPSLDELVPKKHPARVVDEIVNKINTEPLFEAYHTKGCSSYHPVMLLKVIILGYISNIYSSRKLEQSCRENINFMWVSSMNYPDHNTINRFRGVKLKDTLRPIFDEVVMLMAQEGLLSIEEVYTDGTKIEANANKYTFVWKKAVNTNKEKMKKALSEIWQYAQKVATAEDDMPPPPDFTTITKEKINETVEKVNEVLSSKKSVDAKQKAKLHYIKKNYADKIDKYEQQEAILEERNSYSKTDHDATFMRLKEDHMKNGQLKPAYNVQISTSNQYIVNYSLHPNPTDTTTLANHLENHKKSFGKYPTSITADAGYGSEENYELLKQNKVEAYVKYGMFDKEQSQKHNSKNTFSSNKLHYDESKDIFICPMGQPMNYIGTSTRQTTTGFKQTLKRYQAQNCSNCPLNGACHKSKSNRIIEINENLQSHKMRAFELLNSEKGIEKRKKRCWDVEPVFGNIKNNHNFRRFMLRSKKKVTIEWGLIAIAHNIRKKIA